MNYRHSFHAGNFADVMKHVILLLLIDYLQQKSTPVFVLDSHAGRGIYDLAGADALKTGEWQQGIGRLLSLKPPADIEILLAPYLEMVASLNPSGGLRSYPGSSALLRHRLRPQDRALFCDASNSETARLRQLCAGDRRIEVVEGNGYELPRRCLPPRERRGFILIDPPYEAADELTLLQSALDTALRRFAHGVYAIWYPVTASRSTLDDFLSVMAAYHLPKTLLAELTVRHRSASGLIGSGMLIINPPFMLETQLKLLLPWLASALSPEGQGAFTLTSLA